MKRDLFMVPLIKLTCQLFATFATMTAFLRNLLQPRASLAEREPLPAAHRRPRAGSKRSQSDTRRPPGEVQRQIA